MSTINKKLMGFMFSGPALNLAAAPWKGNVNTIYGFNAGGTGYSSFKPTSNFNSLRQLLQDGVYIVDAKTTGFDIPGAVLAAGAPPSVAAVINKALMGFLFGGNSPLALASAPWKGNVNILYGFNAAGSGYISFNPTSNFNSLTQLVQDGAYIIDSTTPGFSLPGAVLAVGALAAPETGVVALVTSEFGQNSGGNTDSNGVHRMALSTISQKVAGATSIVLRQRVDANDGVPTGVAYYLDGVYKGVALQGGLGVADVVLPLPDTAEHTLTLLEGVATRLDDQGPVLSYGTALALVTQGAGTVRRVASTKTADCAYVVCDSIGVGASATTSDKAWLVELRRQLGYDVLCDGYGYRSYSRSLNTSAARSEVLARLQEALSGRTGALHFILDLGTNDYGISYGSAAEMAGCAEQMLSAVLAWNPAVTCWVKTPVSRVYNVSNSLGDSLAKYQAALLGLQTSLPWLRTLDATDWLTVSDLDDDGVHPNDGGHQQLANRYASALRGAGYVVPVGTVAFDINQDYQAGVTDAKTATYAVCRDSRNFPVTNQGTMMIRAKLYNANDYVVLLTKAYIDNGIGYGPGYYTEANKVVAPTYPSSVDFAPGVWCDFLSAWDATGYRTYGRVNGGAIQQVNTPYTPVDSSSENFTVGACRCVNPATASLVAQGVFEQAAFWNFALDDATCLALIRANLIHTPAQYNDARCLIYSPLKRVSGTAIMANLADNARPFDIINVPRL